MKSLTTNKHKILNDPIYGFTSIPNELIFDILEHPYYQRLRRITQLGLTYLVYPGAYHTRFHHALGAMHLMQKAVKTLQSKGHEITPAEETAVLAAILLHDIGHGPFSHALEHSIVNGVNHEDISLMIMDRLNEQFDGKLSLAIQIFKNQHPKLFLHQLISSQLDVDRLDYLKRDSFYTGVSEGVINSDRLISMFNVRNGELVIDAKAIYSVEKFIIARRLMYWQVYLHKAVLSAEFTLVEILKRAKYLVQNGTELFSTLALNEFLKKNHSLEDFNTNSGLLDTFCLLDDFDIMTSVKEWVHHKDKVLSLLCTKIIERKLLKIELQDQPFELEYILEIQKKTEAKFNINPNESQHLVFTDKIDNKAYNPKKDKINLLYKNETIVDIADAADQLNISVLAKTVTKYFLCYPKESEH
ncbi:HD domain-containing protein [Flavobacteriales bacterium]|nr:HD domain-containing protein [Flavobacteriales bacterium]